MAFNIGDIVIYTGTRASGNSSPVGQKYKIIGYHGSPEGFPGEDIRYRMQDLTGRDRGWMTASELKVVLITLESVDEKIKELTSFIEKANEEIQENSKMIELLKKNNIEEATLEQIKILRIFDVFETSSEKTEKMASISKILKEA